MEFVMPNFMVALPEIICLAFACIALLVHLYFGHRMKNIAYCLVQTGLIAAAVAVVMQLGNATALTFNNLFIADGIARLSKLFIFISVFAAFLYSRHYLMDRKMPSGDYYVLGLLSVFGMCLMVSAHSMLMIYLGLEILSLPLYAMVAMHRTEGNSIEAAMKYFVMGAIASGMLLYGMSIMYGVTGQLDIAKIAQVIAATKTEHMLLISFGLVFIVAGLSFKLAAVPFHMWAPDVYTGAPSSVTMLIASAPKIAAFGMVVRLLIFAFPNLFIQWQELLIVLAVLSIGFGNLLAIAQSNLKRMLAYSGIAHIGYMLLGLISGTADGYAASLFYILNYSIMSIAAFGLIVLFARVGFECDAIEDFRGLNSRSPWLAFLMLIVMFSMAGVPPTVGFFAKFLVIKSLISINMIWLAVFALFFALIGAFYYIRVVKAMYFEDPTEQQMQASGAARAIPLDMRVVITINGLALVALGLFPGLLWQACQLAFK